MDNIDTDTLTPQEIKLRLLGLTLVMLGLLAMSGVALFLRQFINAA